MAQSETDSRLRTHYVGDDCPGGHACSTGCCSETECYCGDCLDCGGAPK